MFYFWHAMQLDAAGIDPIFDVINAITFLTIGG